VDRDTLKAFITSHVDLSFARPDPVFVALTHTLPFVLPADSCPLVTNPSVPIAHPQAMSTAVTRLSPSVVDDNDSTPTLSLATAQSALPRGVATISTKAACELWAKDNISTAVLAQLNQPFGKDHVAQSFTVTAVFCHVLCPVIKSGFLPTSSLATLEAACAPAVLYSMLLRTHSLVDFSALWDPIPQDMP
jgi:hypothetical protein